MYAFQIHHLFHHKEMLVSFWVMCLTAILFSVSSLKTTSRTYNKLSMVIVHKMECTSLSECVSDVKFFVRVKLHQGKYLIFSMRLLLIGVLIHTCQRLNVMNMVDL